MPQSVVTENENSEIRYFAAANTYSGFVSFFDDIYKDINKLYILKGGPGTGKNKFMRDIANEANNKNYSVEYYYCASDPKSLDGIIISDLNIGIIDGTAPHTKDPIFPGVRDEIINIGDFWKSDMLNDRREVIIDTINKKSELYSNAYHYLAAVNEIDCELKSISQNAIDIEKMAAAIGRLTKTLKTGDGYYKKVRLLSTISMDGIINYLTFYEKAKHNYIIRDNFSTAHLFLRELLKHTELKKQPVMVSYSPLNPVYENALYFPEISTAFSTSFDLTKLKPDDKIVNMDRFIDHDYIKTNKNKIKFVKCCYNTLMDGALEHFKEIQTLHFDLEEIYTPAMDFKKKEEYTKKFLIKIFK